MRFLLLCLILVSSISATFILANSFSSSQQPPLCSDHEKLALLEFKQSFLTDCGMAYDPVSSYPKVQNWESHKANASEDCCRWEGVECDKGTGHIIGLDLASSCLNGTFPSNNTLFSLTHLEKLSLANNNFNLSQIPTSIGNLYRLRSLNLSSSVFAGQIPSQVSRLSRLTILDLTFYGDYYDINSVSLKFHEFGLDKLVRNLTGLNKLILAGVDLSFDLLPVSLTNLTSLRVLDLRDCNLRGEFPPGVFQLPSLQILSLSLNSDLVGHIPEFSSSSSLIQVILAFTGFYGELPRSIGNLRRLKVLEIEFSHFSGKIPSSVGNLSNAIYFTLEGNNFEGDIPSSITNLTQLYYFGISDLTVKPGILIPWFSKLNNLTYLALMHLVGMNLASEIRALGNLTKLSSLSLRENQITGPVPNWLMNLTHLTFLDLGENQLQGQIPKWFSQLLNLQTLDLSGNSFSSGGFETFLELKDLQILDLSGINLTIPSHVSTNSSLPRFDLLELGLSSCNLTEFPQFLHSQDNLQALFLSGNNIAGNIPQWFLNVSTDSLVTLDLSNNLLTRFEKTPMVLPWRSLKFLDVSGNRLQGPLPSPSSAVEIYLAYDNKLTGEIPNQTCYVSSLRCLDLSNNKLNGHIPSCVGDHLAESLEALDLQGNNFRGNIPQTFPKSCKLKMINLSENQLEGKLPRSLVNCRMLEVLDIGKNHVNDTFPSWLRSLQKLHILVMRNNEFHGQIANPESSSDDFPCLRILDLSGNNLTGSLPFGYFRSWYMKKALDDNQLNASSAITFPFFLTLLDTIITYRVAYSYSITITNKGTERFYSKIMNPFRAVDFSSNNFTGQIPDFIGDPKGLQGLNLSNNNLDGGIPTSIANLKDLEWLDLSHNMLSGEIPQELSQLTFLEVFDVSFNHLVGSIPQGEQFNTFDNSSFVGNTGLCGSPLSKKCGKTLIAPPSSVKNDGGEENSGMIIDWIIRLLGCASGFVVGFVIGKCFITDRYHEWFVDTFGRRKQLKRRAKTS